MASSKVASTDIAIFAALGTEEDIAAHINGLDPDAVPEVLARTGPYKKSLAFIEKSAEQRIVAEGILVLGQEWVDPATGVLNTWGGNLSEWKVPDPDGFARSLASATRRDGSRLVSDEEIARALPLKRVADHRVLSELAKRDAAIAEVVEDNRARSFGPPHLKEKV